MRIAFLTTTLDETVGWGRYAAGFLDEARRRLGAENVVAPDPARLRSRKLRNRQPFAALLDAWKLREELKGVGLIHAATELAAPLAYVLSRFLRVPYVVSVHGTYGDIETYAPPVRWAYRLAFSRASRILAVSRYTADVVRRGSPRAVIDVVPGGFAPAGHAPARTAPSPERRILAVGAIKPRKGFHTLIEALGLLKARGFAFQAECVGPKAASNYVETVEKRAKELGLGERVRFTGVVSDDDLAAAYARADLFVLPSEHEGTAFEGLGLVYLEAMSYGLPVIGCLDSGASDVIQDGVNGALVPPGNPEKLAAAIERVLGDAALWKKLSDAAPKSIDRFRWQVVGQDMRNAYEKTISEYAR